MIADLPERGSFVSWLYRTYIDLTPTDRSGNQWLSGLGYALEAVTEERQRPRLSGVLVPSFRELVIREARLPEYALDDPLKLPAELRSPGWDALCAGLTSVDRGAEVSLRITWLLHKLCLHTAILRYVPEHPETAELAYMRGLARMALYYDGEAPLRTAELEAVAVEAPPGWARVEATYLLVQLHARELADVDAAAGWLREHSKVIEQADADEFTTLKWWSRFHRVGAFVPQLRKDLPAMVAEMDQAQKFAEAMDRSTPEHKAEADALASAVWESRTKEALVLGEPQLAADRARKMVVISPLDPCSYICLGQALVECQEIEQAAAAYHLAGRYGPPETETAFFMLGQCHETLGQDDLACDAYLASLDRDPLGTSSLEQLSGVATRLLNPWLKSWADSRLEQLGHAEEHLLPYQRYGGALGGTA